MINLNNMYLFTYLGRTVKVWSALFFVFLLSCDDKVKEVKVSEKIEIKSEEPESTTEDFYVAALSGVNLRSTPDPKSEIITLAKYGEKIEVLEKTNNEFESDGINGKWYKAKSGDKEGFVFSGFLLNFKPPEYLPNGSFEKYLPKYFKQTEEKQAYSIRYNEGTYERMLTPIHLEKVEIKKEGDAFEVIEKYEGGRFYKEVMGFEGAEKTIFLPGLDMREGYLMMKIILPNLHIIEKCGLEMKKVPFPSKSYKIKVFESCEFSVDVKEENNAVTSVKFENTDYAYSGISVTKVEGGIEITSYLSL